MFEELFREEEEYPPPEESRRRIWLIILGAVGGLILLIAICVALYQLVLTPYLQGRQQTQAAMVESTNAVAIQTISAGVVQPTSIPAPLQTATRLPTSIPTLPEATPTSSPTTPSVSPTTSSTTTRLPSPSSTASPTGIPTILLSDSFGQVGGGWPTSKGDTYEIGFASGGYRMVVDLFNADIWAVRDYELTGMVLEVDGKKLSGPEDGYFGLLCRFSSSGNYYSLVIDNSGRYRIYKKVASQITDLGTPGRSNEIQSGEVNRIRAECVGDRLAIYVNGQKLLEVRDDTFQEGLPGLVAGTLQNPGLEVLFDNFVLATP